MSTATDCKRQLEIEIPLEQVEQAKERVTNSIKQRVRLPGFRPGKAPVSLVQSRFEREIREEVLEVLLPQAFRERVSKDGLNVVGTPNIADLHFEPGEAIRFKADFEVAPEIELPNYQGLPVKYEEPAVTDEEVSARLDAMRDSKAEYVNQDPRAIETGDHVLVQLKSVAGLDEPIDEADLPMEVGGADTLPVFTENLVGGHPDETKEFDVSYPEDYGRERLAGKTVRFQLTAKTIRKKELPPLDDEFAKDIGGEYQTLDDLKEAIKKSIFHEKQYEAQQSAKEQLIDKLVDSGDFPVPEVYVERQMENQVRASLRDLAGKGIDPSTIKLDWEKVKETQRDRALRNVRASLLLEKISEKEGIKASQEEIDREVQRVARSEREAMAVTRARLEKEGMLQRIADHIQTEKTIQYLFDRAQKQA